MQYAWLDGKFIPLESAKVSILTHSMQYGSGIFEGIRAYDTGRGTAIFRLKDHFRRFEESAGIYGMSLGYGAAELGEAACGLVKKNRLKSCYIRPFAFYNDARIGLGVSGKKISVMIAAIEFGSYFKEKERGIKCKVSSWHRINSGILPVRAKASGNYINSIIASKEAADAGADEAIMLSGNGYVAEGPGENIFLEKNGSLITPSESSDILLGITRDSIIKIAQSRGITVSEREVHREELYTSSELFFTGTAAEITPITDVDGRRIGSGTIGPITRLLSNAFAEVIRGKDKAFFDWLSFV